MLPAHDRDHRLEEEAAEGSAIGVQELEVDQDEALELGTTSAMGSFAAAAAAAAAIEVIEVIDLVDADSEEPIAIEVIDLVDADSEEPIAIEMMDLVDVDSEEPMKLGAATKMEDFTLTEEQHSSNCAGCKSKNCMKMKACA